MFPHRTVPRQEQKEFPFFYFMKHLAGSHVNTLQIVKTFFFFFFLMGWFGVHGDVGFNVSFKRKFADLNDVWVLSSDTNLGQRTSVSLPMVVCREHFKKCSFNIRNDYTLAAV